MYPELAAMYGARVPDHRGLFKRGYGGQAHAQVNGSIIGVTSTLHESGALGQVQGDATRQVWGQFVGFDHDDDSNMAWQGPFVKVGINAGAAPNAFDIGEAVTNFDISRVVPTAGDIRPANTATRYLMRALR